MSRTLRILPALVAFLAGLPLGCSSNTDRVPDLTQRPDFARYQHAEGLQILAGPVRLPTRPGALMSAFFLKADNFSAHLWQVDAAHAVLIGPQGESYFPLTADDAGQALAMSRYEPGPFPTSQWPEPDAWQVPSTCFLTQRETMETDVPGGGTAGGGGGRGGMGGGTGGSRGGAGAGLAGGRAGMAGNRGNVGVYPIGGGMRGYGPAPGYRGFAPGLGYRPPGCSSRFYPYPYSYPCLNPFYGGCYTGGVYVGPWGFFGGSLNVLDFGYTGGVTQSTYYGPPPLFPIYDDATMTGLPTQPPSYRAMLWRGDGQIPPRYTLRGIVAYPLDMNRLKGQEIRLRIPIRMVADKPEKTSAAGPSGTDQPAVPPATALPQVPSPFTLAELVFRVQ